MIRVVLPPHLSTLARVGREVQLGVAGSVTQRSILDALENAYPMLRGTIRDQVTHLRRPLLRFFVCEEDISHDPPDAELPPEVASGKEAFYIIGAIVGGSGIAKAVISAGVSPGAAPGLNRPCQNQIVKLVEA
jgi:hypothetical protein